MPELILYEVESDLFSPGTYKYIIYKKNTHPFNNPLIEIEFSKTKIPNSISLKKCPTDKEKLKILEIFLPEITQKLGVKLGISSNEFKNWKIFGIKGTPLYPNMKGRYTSLEITLNELPMIANENFINQREKPLKTPVIAIPKKEIKPKEPFWKKLFKRKR